MPGDFTDASSRAQPQASVAPSMNVPPTGDSTQTDKLPRLRELFLEEHQQISAAANRQGISIRQVLGSIVQRAGPMIGEWVHVNGKVEARSLMHNGPEINYRARC